MADVKNPKEPTLPIKRSTPDTPSSEPKKPKLINNSETPSLLNDAVSEEPKVEQQQEEDEEQVKEEVNGKDVIDRKGKGILIEEEVEDEDGDDDDDDDDSDSESDSDSGIGDGLSDESDFADDPLAEVDLDNILPSRTRRKTIHPGVYLAADLPEDDSDEIDDPDA